MVETHDHFIKRLKSLGRKHAQLTHGYVTRVGKDGLIVVKPKRARRGFPFQMLFMLVIGFFGFKAFMLSAIGPVTYNERLAKLENGSVLEQAGAKALGIDPITASVAKISGPMLRR
ncbi:hypothetical protein SAMN04488523_108137 [Sulfitobacter brevis]|uniref:Uncharacterized protein n=1 Tax=Sulfitobacter brevis TaxID=74348 RepID=A0A1I2BLW3_9RHOB|nr:hypothetical protein [Sulfitobacter brevis]SFE56798.1 hypothetical protein SAMN04488523_108137 [Sulfitobacter brevis]